MKAETIKIKLGGRGNHVAIVDEQDRWALRYRWHINGKGYVQRWRNGAKSRLHREILGDACQGLLVDHINHDTLDNRRCNLRAVTNSQNMQNRKGAQSGSATTIRGVYRHGPSTFRAGVQHDGKHYSAGLFDTIEEAGAAAAVLRRALGFLTDERVRTND